MMKTTYLCHAETRLGLNERYAKKITCNRSVSGEKQCPRSRTNFVMSLYLPSVRIEISRGLSWRISARFVRLLSSEGITGIHPVTRLNPAVRIEKQSIVPHGPRIPACLTFNN